MKIVSSCKEKSLRAERWGGAGFHPARDFSPAVGSGADARRRINPALHGRCADFQPLRMKIGGGREIWSTQYNALRAARDFYAGVSRYLLT